MRMKYIDWVTLKIAVMFVIAVIGVPAYFIMGAPNWELVLVYIIVGYITYNFAQICYHRWLCHFQFEPNWLGRKILLATPTIETGFSGKNLWYVIDCMSFTSVTY